MDEGVWPQVTGPTSSKQQAIDHFSTVYTNMSSSTLQQRQDSATLTPRPGKRHITPPYISQPPPVAEPSGGKSECYAPHLVKWALSLSPLFQIVGSYYLSSPLSQRSHIGNTCQLMHLSSKVGDKYF
ncbi:unnamed protein product [Chrysoparadoxa australica]